MKKIIIAISGASGAIYSKLLIEKLLLYKNQIKEIAVIFSDNSKCIWEDEIGVFLEESENIKIYSNKDFHAPFASGSNKWDTMIICPCSVGMLGRIAHGISNDLISRSADVILKEKRRLILVLREMPYNLIHIENMKTVTLTGGIICPANPSFYSKPKTIEELAYTVVDRALDLAGLDISAFRWNHH